MFAFILLTALPLSWLWAGCIVGESTQDEHLWVPYLAQGDLSSARSPTTRTPSTFCLHWESSVSQHRPQHTELPLPSFFHSTLNNQTPNIYQQCRKTLNFKTSLIVSLEESTRTLKLPHLVRTTAGTNILSGGSGTSRISLKHLTNLPVYRKMGHKVYEKILKGENCSRF